jgi:hypothetical protein
MNSCRWCGCRKIILQGTGVFGVVTICLNCDTAPATNPGNRLSAGPPKLPGSKNGWFLP